MNMSKGQRKATEPSTFHTSDLRPPYQYAVLDPSLRTEAGGDNRHLLGPRTLGIEVTESELAAGCGLGNIDPQHEPSSESELTAIEASLSHPLPPCKSQLVTIRPDLDSIGAMAVLSMRADKQKLDESAKARISRIAVADAFRKGPWQANPKLATAIVELSEIGGECRGQLSCESTTVVSDLVSKLADRLEGDFELASLAAYVADCRVPLKHRVFGMKTWIKAGSQNQDDSLAKYLQSYEKKSRALLLTLGWSLAQGELKVTHACDIGLAVVEGSQWGAMRLGYAFAPVVIAHAPNFESGKTQAYSKFTIAQYAEGFLNLTSVAKALASHEDGWGGSKSIIGSPQGRSSLWALRDVVEVVTSAICKEKNRKGTPARTTL